ncbi:MAG: hypothetical protein EOO38_04445 [Cytophagaceae bacterium]|nr:MAG: hypothetical protein EOO38_04445 [Cytophagaceae bacterium]
MRNPKQELVDAIILLNSFNIESTPDDLRRVNSLLIQALLNYGSETEENKDAVGKLQFVVERRELQLPPRLSLVVGDGKIPLTEIVYQCESIQIPEEISRRIEDISQEDWKSCFRIIQLMLNCVQPE